VDKNLGCQQDGRIKIIFIKRGSKMEQQQINVQDLFAIIGEQQLSIRMLQQKLQSMQAALDDFQKGKKDEKSNLS